MSRQVSVTIYRETDAGEIPIEVTADCSPEEPRRMPGPRDDVGDPGCPASIDITSALLPDGTAVELTQAEIDWAEDKIREEFPDDDRDYDEDRE